MTRISFHISATPGRQQWLQSGTDGLSLQVPTCASLRNASMSVTCRTLQEHIRNSAPVSPSSFLWRAPSHFARKTSLATSTKATSTMSLLLHRIISKMTNTRQKCRLTIKLKMNKTKSGSKWKGRWLISNIHLLYSHSWQSQPKIPKRFMLFLKAVAIGIPSSREPTNLKLTAYLKNIRELPEICK